MARSSHRNRIGSRVVIIETIWALTVYAVSVLVWQGECFFTFYSASAISIWWSFLIVSQLIAEWIDRERGDWDYLFFTFADRIRKPVLGLWLILLMLAAFQGARYFSLIALQTSISAWVILARRVRWRIVVEIVVSAFIRYVAFIDSIYRHL